MRATRFRSAPRASDQRHALHIRAARFPFEKAGRGGRAIAILYVKFGRAQVQATFSSFAADALASPSASVANSEVATAIIMLVN